jgi:glutamate-5-semialdehyde dehydrogenase
MRDERNTPDLQVIGRQARSVAYALAELSTPHKDELLAAIADALEARLDEVLAANAQDLAAARANGTDPVWIRDRLDLTRRMGGVIADVRHVITLVDPVGGVIDRGEPMAGLQVRRVRVPIGVLGAIYEARPQVTVDIATLALKTGNAVILRGGSDAQHSNRALVGIIRDVLAAQGVDPNAVQFIDSTDRRFVAEMLKMHDFIDMIIPRGGNALHAFCRENSTIPVITGGIGICHLYADETADMVRSLPVIHNAKTQRPAVCNALDTLLVHASVAAELIPQVVAALGADGVVFRADPRAFALVDDERVTLAGPEDFDTEWIGLTLGLKVVDDLEEAIAHIRAHSTQHSDGILSENADHVARFFRAIDSAVVYHNASTRFTDGSALGLGAEVAVSTQKLHARGPMALEALTTYKWIVEGDYTPRP